MPYYFSYVNEDHNEEKIAGFADKVVMRHPDDVTWCDLLKIMPQFLMACGFVIPNHLRCILVDEETGEEYTAKNYYDL